MSLKFDESSRKIASLFGNKQRGHVGKRMQEWRKAACED